MTKFLASKNLARFRTPARAKILVGLRQHNLLHLVCVNILNPSGDDSEILNRGGHQQPKPDFMFCTNMKQRHVTLHNRRITSHASQVSDLANVVSKTKQFQAQNAARPLSTLLVTTQSDSGMRSSWSEPSLPAWTPSTAPRAQ